MQASGSGCSYLCRWLYCREGHVRVVQRSHAAWLVFHYSLQSLQFIASYPASACMDTRLYNSLLYSNHDAQKVILLILYIPFPKTLYHNSNWIRKTLSTFVKIIYLHCTRAQAQHRVKRLVVSIIIIYTCIFVYNMYVIKSNGCFPS